MQIPSIDQSVCGQWTEQQLDLYNKYPFYLMEATAQFRKYWVSWKKLFGKINWKPNMGDTMRRVANEPTPVMRQTAFPNRLSSIPLTDVLNYRERITDSYLQWQDFESPHFYFLPEFQDFMKHVKTTQDNINRQMMIYEDVFLRTNAFYKAPYVYVVGYGLVAAPTAMGNAAGDAIGSKTTGWIQNQLINLSASQPGYLSFQELFKVLNAFEQEVGGTPFEGTGMPKADSSPLNEKFCLVTSGETWNNFVDDPWLKENRPLNMDIVTEGFKGDLFGRIRTKIERYPMRYAVDNDLVPSLPVPEVTEENPEREDYGRTVPNPLYSKPSNSPFEVAYLVGGSSYDAIDSGPPPAEYTRGLEQSQGFKMNWNGQCELTKNFLVPCRDANGNYFYDANSRGRYLRLQGTLCVGVSGVNPQNILPIIFKRRIGINTVT